MPAMLTQIVLTLATLTFVMVWAKVSVDRKELVSVPIPIILLFLAAWGMKLDILKALVGP